METLKNLLGLELDPVAVTFLEEPPAGVPRVPAATAAGCGYWALAAAGEVFHTRPEDHLGCPIGAWTHGVLDTAHEDNLNEIVGRMLELRYLRQEELEHIPRRTERPGVIVYAPLCSSPCPPDAVIVRGTPRQVMLLREALESAGMDGASDEALGRPTCAAVAQATSTGRSCTNLGCIGNRVYTDLDDAELYQVLPGEAIEPLVVSLRTMLAANVELEAYHRSRLQEAGA